MNISELMDFNLGTDIFNFKQEFGDENDSFSSMYTQNLLQNEDINLSMLFGDSDTLNYDRDPLDLGNWDTQNNINEELPLFPSNMDTSERQKEEFTRVLSQFTSHMDIEAPEQIVGLNFSDQEFSFDIFEDTSLVDPVDIPNELQPIKLESVHIKQENLEQFEEDEDDEDDLPESVIIVKNEDIKEEDIDIETVSDSTITVIEAGDVTTLLEQFEATEQFNRISPIKLKCDPTTQTYVIQHQEKKSTNVTPAPLKNSRQNINVAKKKNQKAIQQENQLPNKQSKQQMKQQAISKVKHQTNQLGKKQKKQQVKKQPREIRQQSRQTIIQQPHQTLDKSPKQHSPQPVIQQSKQQSHQTLGKQPKEQSHQHVIQQAKQRVQQQNKQFNQPAKQQSQQPVIQQSKQQSSPPVKQQSQQPVIQQSKQQSNPSAKQQSLRPVIQQSKHQSNQQSIEKIKPQNIHQTSPIKKQSNQPTTIQVKQHLFDQAIDQNIKLNYEATQRSKQVNQKSKSSTSKNIVRHSPKTDYTYKKNDIPSRPLKSQEVSVQLDHAYCTPSLDRHIITPKIFYQSILSEYDKNVSNNPNLNSSIISQAKDDTRKDSGLESGEVSDASEEAQQHTSISIQSSNLTTVVVTKPSGLVSVLKRSQPKTISGVINNPTLIPTPTKTTVIVDTGPAASLSNKSTAAVPKKRKLNLDEYRNRLKKRVSEDDDQPSEKNISEEISIMHDAFNITKEKEKDESGESKNVSKSPEKEKTKTFRKNAIRKRNYRTRHCSSDSNSSTERYRQRKRINSDSDSRRSTSQSSNSSRRSSSNSSARYSRSRSRSRSRSKSSTRSYSRSRSRSYSRSHSRTRSRSNYRYKSRSRSRNRRFRYQSRSYSRSRSRSGSRFRSSSREWIYRPNSRPSSVLPPLDRKEKQRQVDERRVVYVGRLEEGITKAELRTQFEVFGTIIDISIHFREHGDNYGFVTFSHKEDAYNAVEKGKYDSQCRKYDLCFGGRRAFCRSRYADLDGMATSEKYNSYPYRSYSTSISPPRCSSPPPPSRTFDFDYLLRQAKADVHRNTKTENNTSNQL